MEKSLETWLIAEVAAAARAEVLPRFRALSAGDIDTKSAPDDLVTVADTACERALTAALAKRWPEALVVGEEAVASDPALLDRIGAAETCVIIDPIDGTWNFANGLSLFGVIIAVTRCGKPIWGGLYDPLLDDWVIGREGQGATTWTATGEKPIQWPDACPTKLEEMSGYVPLFLYDAAIQPKVANVLPRFRRAISLRCSCHEYRMMAQGRVDFMISGMLKPWDHAAGVAAVLAAGGVVRHLDGRDYSAASTEGTLLAARSEDAWHTLAETFSFLS